MNLGFGLVHRTNERLGFGLVHRTNGDAIDKINMDQVIFREYKTFNYENSGIYALTCTLINTNSV